MNCDSLYLSPHLDDAVLSCAARIRQETAAGKGVVVATLFTEADDAREELYQRRRAEDVRAVKSLGAKALHCGLKDAPFRRSYYSSFRPIILGSHPGDDEDEKAVRHVLDDLLRSCAPDRVFCPLGVGRHIDHRLAYQAAVAVRGFRRLIFYEDRPYVLVRGQLAMRLAELSLQGAVPAETEADFLKSFREANYVRTYLHESERIECETLLLKKLADPSRRRRVRSETIDSSSDEEMVTAISLYETQMPDLYGSAELFRGASLNYSTSLGALGYAERYWQEE
jgi:LmbE family N-acetylglucosaminyl deacetylase